MKLKKFILFLITYIVLSAICYWIIFLSDFSVGKLKTYSWIISFTLCYIGAYWFSKWITTNNDKEK